MNVTPETATKFKEHLVPMSGDAYFVDEVSEFSDMSSREISLRMVPTGEEGFYNVQNTITKLYVNNAPLTLKEATALIKGNNIKPVYDEYEDKKIKDEFNEDEEDEVDTPKKDDDEDEKTFADYMQKEAPNQIPFISNIINTITYDGSFLPATSPIVETGKGIMDMLTAEKTSTRIKGGIDFLSSIGVISGVAGSSQAGDLIKDYVKDAVS